MKTKATDTHQDKNKTDNKNLGLNRNEDWTDYWERMEQITNIEWWEWTEKIRQRLKKFLWREILMKKVTKVRMKIKTEHNEEIRERRILINQWLN
jgi:hypothetical protein